VICQRAEMDLAVAIAGPDCLSFICRADHTCQ
jgi:hypothetical protein